MNYDPLRCAAVLPAAGSGSRVGATVNKLLLPLAGEPLLTHTLRAVAAAGLGQVVLVTRPGEREPMAAIARAAGCPVTFAMGGATRQESVAAGLAALLPDIVAVAVHDGARPLVSPDLFHTALQHAVTLGSGVAALPVVDTLKRAAAGVVAGAVNRDELVAMQTPQAFQVPLLRRAAEAARATGLAATDEAGLVEALGEPVYLVPGSPRNLKVTQPEDFALAAALLAAGQERTEAMDVRIGYGYDVHRLEPGRELWLGGVQIDSPVGLLGHSDADALLHAITDALLGAAALGDIGRHFPDTDPAYRGIRSMLLLERAYALVREQGFEVQNVDATVVAQRPRLAPHIPAMVERIAAGLAVTPTRVNVKATTHEGLDDLGAGLGIAAHAVVLLARVAGESRETC